MDIKETALYIADVLDKKKGSDIVIIDISEKSGFADYFVIAQAASLRQLDALMNEVEDALAKEEIFVKHIEGRGESGWVLMDYGDIIVNLFTQEQRNRYQIEKVWKDCPAVDFEPAAATE